MCIVLQLKGTRDFLLHGTYLQKTLRILICFRLALFHCLQCLISFSQIDHLLRHFVRFLTLILLRYMRLSQSSDLLLNIVLGDFNVHHTEWLTYYGGTVIFLSQMTLLKWLTFLLGSLTVTLTVLLFWIYLFFLTIVFVLQWLSLRSEILIILLSQFSFSFLQTQKTETPFLRTAYDYAHKD